jgi:hypothetical protein
LAHGPKDRFADRVRDVATGSITRVDAARNLGTFVHPRVSSITGVDNRLKRVRIPASELDIHVSLDIDMCRKQGTYKIAVISVTSTIATREPPGRLSLALCPPTTEEWGIPVGLIEDVRGVDPALRTVGPARLGGALTAGILHVIVEVIQTSGRVIARGEMDITTHGGSITVAVLVGKADAGA